MSSGPPGIPEEQIRHRVKLELRKRMRAVRGALPASACEARSSEIAKRVIALPAFQSAKTVLAFASIGREVRTRVIMEAAWGADKRVALPRVVEEQLHLHLVYVDTTLVEGAFTVPEPPSNAATLDAEEVDFALVPALAVDPRGFRVGYGGGYYDRLLPRLTGAYSCAVAFDFQLIAEVPELPFDVAVQAVVTDKRTLEPE